VAENDNIELKKRSRRRLVGAAALALIAAIILPMVMDDEPGVPVQDIQVTIPDRDADSRLARPIVGRVPLIVDDEPLVPPTPDELLPDPDVAAIDPLPQQPPVAPPVAPSDAVQPSVPASPATPSRPAPSAPVSGNGEAERVRAILEGRASAAAESAQSFFVQAGAFSDANKAASLSNDLKSRGFTAFTEQAGAVTRVRVGPFSSRGEADKVVERLAGIGLDGVVTAR